MYKYKDKYVILQPPHTEACFDKLRVQMVKDDALPKIIIEIGTAQGGLTLMLADKFPNTPIWTYDIGRSTNHIALSENPNIYQNIQDVFKEKVTAEIVALLQRPGTALLLCDGGDKIREYKLFAPSLKEGDFIFAHDADFDGKMPAYWPYHEISDPWVAQATKDCKLDPYLQEVMKDGAWLSKRKKGKVKEEKEKGKKYTS